VCCQMCELSHSHQSFFCNTAHASRTLTRTNGGMHRCPRFLPLSLSWPSWLSELRRSHTHRTCTFSNRTVTRGPTASRSSATRQSQLAGCWYSLRPTSLLGRLDRLLAGGCLAHVATPQLDLMRRSLRQLASTNLHSSQRCGLEPARRSVLAVPRHRLTTPLRYDRPPSPANSKSHASRSPGLCYINKAIGGHSAMELPRTPS
jgi:hypothetical protein